MKKYLNFAFVLVAGLSVVLSCSKIEKEIDNPVVPAEEEVTVQDITLTAILPESDTKVSYEATYGTDFKPTAVTRKWETTDKLKIWNQDHSNSTVLDLDSGDGTNTAVFKGQIDFTSASYDIEVLSATECSDYAHQSQASDGDMSHIAFVAGQSGVTDLTAAITLTETSGVLAIIAQLPDGAAEEVKSITISDLATGSPVIALLIANKGDADTDGLFKAYMNVTSGMSLAQDNEYLIRFNTPDATTQKYYTRYYKMGSKKDLGDGKFQYIKLNCKHTDQHAGSPTACDGTSADKAYLIADKYQLLAMDGLLASEKRYFKLVDDIDMLGVAWSRINPSSPYKPFDLDGNNKTISNLGEEFIYIINGTVKDLTLDKATSTKRGILAEYIQASGNVVSNVTITNSSVTSASSNTGALIGRINNGTDASIVTATITDCTVSNTLVVGPGIVGGVVGVADAKVEISGCIFTGGSVTATAQFSGGLIGSATDYASTITDCHVLNTTITSSADRVGGLAGQTQKKTAVINCSATNVTITGTINLGGLVGVLYGSATDCTSTGGSITSSNTTSNTDIGLGGLAGWLQYGIISHCSSSVSINQTTNGRDIGGLVGKMVDGTIEKSYATGNVSGIQRNVGGLVGLITLDSGTASISNCYCTGNVTANSYCGGFLGLQEKGSVLIQNCYASGNISATGGFAAGGMIGVASTADFTMSNSAAWNGSITPKNYGAENWSSGAVVGVTFPKCTLTDNYRNPAMSLTAYWVPAAGFNHPNVNSTHSLTDSGGAEMSDTGTGKGQAHYPQYPYQGKVEAGKTLSQLASTTLGWDSAVWDFTGDLPTLK